MLRDILIAAAGIKPEWIHSQSFVQNAATGNTLSIPKPAGVEEGDLLILFHSASSPSSTANSWTTIADGGWNTSQTGTTNLLARGWKVASVSETATYTSTASSSSYKLSGIIMCIKKDKIYINPNTDSANIFSYVASDSSPTTVTSSMDTNILFKPSLVIGYLTLATASKTWSTSAGEIYSSDSDTNGPSSSIFFDERLTSIINYTGTTQYDLTNSKHLRTLVINATGASLHTYSSSITAAASTTVTSSAITVSSNIGSINVYPPSGVTFAKNGGTYSSSGSVAHNDTVTLKAVASTAWNNSTTHEIDFGGLFNYSWTVDTDNEAVWDGSVSYQTFTVPQNISQISMLAVGIGGEGGNAISSGLIGSGGGGGACVYTNNVSVTPGEQLTISKLNDAAQLAWVKRGGTAGTTLIAADYGRAGNSSTSGGTGGAAGTAANSTGTVKYSGSNGLAGSSGSSVGGSGGTAGTLTANGTAAVAQTTAGYGGNSGGSTVVNPGTTGNGSWTVSGIISATSRNGASASTSSFNAGGGGGGGIYNTAMGIGGNGNGALVVFVWGGRTFSSSSSF